jgi:hypothetical protein
MWKYISGMSHYLLEMCASLIYTPIQTHKLAHRLANTTSHIFDPKRTRAQQSQPRHWLRSVCVRRGRVQGGFARRRETRRQLLFLRREGAFQLCIFLNGALGRFAETSFADLLHQHIHRVSEL